LRELPLEIEAGSALFLIMPQPVIGALMVFTASFMIAGGI